MKTTDIIRICFFFCVGILIATLIEKLFISAKPTVNPRSYQIQCTPDSIYIYDGEKRIGVIDYDDNSNFSNLILNDNL